MAQTRGTLYVVKRPRLSAVSGQSIYQRLSGVQYHVQQYKGQQHHVQQYKGQQYNVQQYKGQQGKRQ